MKTIKLLILAAFSVIIFNSCNNDVDDNPTISAAISAQFYKSSLSLAVGGREKIMLTLDSDNAVLDKPKWSSSDTTIVSVTADGVVKAKAKGEALISLTASNNISGNCKIEVTESPVKNLVMPESQYTIAKDAIVLLKGEGFTKNSKLFLRPHADYETYTKSASVDGDILVQIGEQALNYISFYASVNVGWYNVILEENGKQYDFGNIEIEKPYIPAYVYDKNKLFWEDTHWRLFQLRGKVKKIRITKSHVYSIGVIWNEIRTIQTTQFNDAGFVVETFIEEGGVSDMYKYQYNKANKPTLVTINSKYVYNSKLLYDNISEYKFEYGNHSFYVPTNHFLNRDDHLFPLCSYGGTTDVVYGSFEFQYLYLKGLTKLQQYQDGKLQYEAIAETPIGNNSLKMRFLGYEGYGPGVYDNLITYNFQKNLPVEKEVDRRFCPFKYEYYTNGLLSKITAIVCDGTHPNLTWEYTNDPEFNLFKSFSHNSILNVGALVSK